MDYYPFQVIHITVLSKYIFVAKILNLVIDVFSLSAMIKPPKCSPHKASLRVPHPSFAPPPPASHPLGVTYEEWLDQYVFCSQAANQVLDLNFSGDLVVGHT